MTRELESSTIEQNSAQQQQQIEASVARLLQDSLQRDRMAATPALLPERVDERLINGRPSAVLQGVELDAPGSTAECLHTTLRNPYAVRPRRRYPETASISSVGGPVSIAVQAKIMQVVREALGSPDSGTDVAGTLATAAAGGVAGVLESAGRRAVALARLRELGSIAIPCLIAALDSNRFADREVAMAGLRMLGPAALPALFQLLDNPSTNLEQSRRAEMVIMRIMRDSGDTAAYDAQGRLRILVDPERGTPIFRARYTVTPENPQGSLHSLEINERRFAVLQGGVFVDQQTGETYTRASVDQSGNVTLHNRRGGMMLTPDRRTFNYTADHRLESIILPDGCARYFQYDTNNRCTGSYVITPRMRPRF